MYAIGTRGFILFICSIALLFGATSVHGYTIFGQLKNIKWKKNIKIGLAAINSIEQFKGLKAEQYICVGDIDRDGNFVLKGNNLPDEERFYRIYLMEDNYYVLYQIPNLQNFIDFVISNNSLVELRVDLSVSCLYQAHIKGVKNIQQYLDFYREIYYLLSAPSASPSKQAFDKAKVTRLIKGTMARNGNPFYAILVLASIDLDLYYHEDPGYFAEVIDELDEKAPNNIYVNELLVKKATYDFSLSPVNQFLNAKVFTLLLAIILLLSCVLVYAAVKIARARKVSIIDTTETLTALTRKEREIVELLKNGKTNKEIATLLFIEISTVKTHVNSIFQKLKVSSRTELLSQHSY